MADHKLSLVTTLYFCTLVFSISAQNLTQFTYNGFQQAKLHLDGIATVHPNGLLELTNTSKQIVVHAFYPHPLKFNLPSSLSFSTTFAFSMSPEIEALSGHGIVFFLSPSMSFPHAMAGGYLGLFNSSTIGNFSNHIFGVELDTVQNLAFADIDNNHVGIDINDVHSNASAPAGYFSDAGKQNKSLSLASSKPVQVWIDYDDTEMVVNVTIAPLGEHRPSKPLLSCHVDLSQVVLDTMYVGFSASNGPSASSHYILGWSFSQGRRAQAQSLDLSKLPWPPRIKSKRKLSMSTMILIIVSLVIAAALGLFAYVRWKKRFQEILEDWEQEYLLQRFSYKDLYRATKAFKDSELIGIGGFGKVYKGVVRSTKAQVAVKKVSHGGTGEGMKEFVAEIACMGRLRHRNLVQLLGYCRRKGELLLVYDYMPNGSLDKYLYGHGKPCLLWSQRYKIIRGLAGALVYLHEEWEQLIVHRDIKPSNVLLDAEMNARLGDFGLARLYDHGTNPQTTHVVGTVGYLAPELLRSGKANASTDVFSFGVLILEVASGRSPASVQDQTESFLVDWVHDCWKKGVITEASDPKLEGEFVMQEMQLALMLGMLCSHSRPEARPTMRQAMQFLDGETTLPLIIPDA